jgi:hypothetical protein
MRLQLDPERMKQEFLPLAVAMLQDRSRRVRRVAADALGAGWAADVPIELLAAAFLDEKHPVTRARMERLLRAALASRRGREGTSGAA